MKITVMGLGYIGLPTAITLAEAGFEVCGFDVNKNTIETLQGGHIHIVEPGLQEAFEKAVAHGHLHFSKELGKSDVFYISVPTPFFKDENGSYICRELLAGINTDTNPMPEARTESYYKKRPCAELAACAADILERHLEELQK